MKNVRAVLATCLLAAGCNQDAPRMDPTQSSLTTGHPHAERSDWVSSPHLSDEEKLSVQKSYGLPTDAVGTLPTDVQLHEEQRLEVPSTEVAEALDETIQIGDSLAETVEKLAKQGIAVQEIVRAVMWRDGQSRREYRLSRTRIPKDALILVTRHKADGIDARIESMYWELDFIKQYVPKSTRPPEQHEDVETVELSALVSELQEVME